MHFNYVLVRWLMLVWSVNTVKSTLKDCLKSFKAIIKMISGGKKSPSKSIISQKIKPIILNHSFSFIMLLISVYQWYQIEIHLCWIHILIANKLHFYSFRLYHKRYPHITLKSLLKYSHTLSVVTFLSILHSIPLISNQEIKLSNFMSELSRKLTSKINLESNNLHFYILDKILITIKSVKFYSIS